MKSKSISSRVSERYGMIEPLEARIAPAAIAGSLPANVKFVTVTTGGAQLVKAGEVLTTGPSGGGSYLLYVQAGQVLVHTTDLNSSGQFEFNDVTGLSVGNGASFISFVDIHGDIVTDLNSDGTLTDGGKGDILLDANIAGIELRALAATDFAGTATQTPTELANAHLALSSFSIFGNIYAGGGLGLPNDAASGLQIDNSGDPLMAAKYTGTFSSNDYYQAVEPVIGSIYAGTSATGQSFSFGYGKASNPSAIYGNLLAFTPSSGEAGASIYNIGAASTDMPFSIGTIHAGNGGFNGAGGNVVNVQLQGDNAGTYKVIAGNAGPGTTGQNGGSIINFSEAGATISEVVLQSGSGGTGYTGAGGNAGSISLNPASAVMINAHVVLNYGNGGNGYGNGGNGGGTTSGTFVTPVGTLTSAINLTSLMHTIGSVGSNVPIQFTNSGYSDMVFSTTNPNQVVVALGGPTSSTSTAAAFTPSGYIYLNSPAQVESIVVGDFGSVNGATGQLEPDIAVASGIGSNAGVEVYMSQYNAKTGAFMGFSDPIFNPLPSLDHYFTGGSTTPAYLATTTSITKLTAGDFNGDGVMDLAVVAQETATGTFESDSVLFIMQGEHNMAYPNGNGHFFADFSGGQQPFLVLGPSVDFNPTKGVIEATALQSFAPSTHGTEAIGLSTSTGNPAANNFYIITAPTGVPVLGNGQSYGNVGALGPFYGQSFVFTQDQNQAVGSPINADIVALSGSPLGYLETFSGNGTGTFNAVAQANFAFGSTQRPVAIVTTPGQTNSNSPILYSNVAVLDYDSTGPDIIEVFSISANLGNVTLSDAFDTIAPAAQNTANVAFGSYVPHPAPSTNVANSGPAEYGFITGNPVEAYPDLQYFAVTEPMSTLGNVTSGAGAAGAYNYAPFKNAGYFVTAGSGGNSESGAGGNGGSFGQTLSVSGSGLDLTGLGSLSIVFPDDPTYQGTLNMTAGNGGNGFNHAGNGGSIQGFSLTYTTGTTVLTGGALLFAGNGGQSLTGTGGTGGSLSQLYVESGTAFIAGNGGIGVIGGAGGSLVGNPTSGLAAAVTNNVDPILVLKAGNGANGVIGGGNGGSINAFVNDFNPYFGFSQIFLNYNAGNGGNAVDGTGGAGGSITNSSPSEFDNNIAGDIALTAGAGGNGMHGGAGGAIDNFLNISTVKAVPTSGVFIAGAGGNGILQGGGAGGSINNIAISATGVGTLYTFNFTNPQLLLNPMQAETSATPISYDRIVAGQGGSSLGAAGGVGGSVSSINSTATNATSANAVIAGAGGNGLTAGGAGGSVTSATVDAGSQAQVLIVAGDGGNSLSVKPANSTPAAIAAAIGGVNGPGGKGGSILNFVQPTTTGTDVDLIAGNGGNTLAHSVAAGNATTDNSGAGGSILNISVAGNIGDSTANVAILSYNNILSSTPQTMQQWVDSYILGTPGGPLTDAQGNVGLVAGAAGRVEGVANGMPSTFAPLGPSANGTNGSVSNVYAENIMSMVAGSVDQVALIESLTNYGVTIANGILGAQKTAYVNTASGTLSTTEPNYIGIGGNIVDTPLPGGTILIDGAFVAMNIRDIQSIRDFQGTVPG
jgi:hypothetical protein